MSEEQCKHHLLCWMFRMAQKKWKKTPSETGEIFKKYDLYDYLNKAYEWTHLESYETAFINLNLYLNSKGVFF